MLGVTVVAPAEGGGGGAQLPTSQLSIGERILTDGKNLVGDVVSEVGIGVEQVQQAGLGVVDSIAGTGAQALEMAKGVLGWGTPATAAPSGPVTLTSQCEEAQPSPRTRTKLGVGERVVLTVSGGAGNWTVSGGKLSAKTGTTVTLTAPERPGTSEVTVDVGGTKATLSFTVIAPNVVNMTRVGQNHENNSFPNAGMTLQPYFGPDDVNFVNVSFIEDDIGAKATGYWDEFNGIGHQPNTAHIGCSNTVVAGRGTLVNANDGVQSGWITKAPPLTDWSGTLTFLIPWHWKCGSGKGLIQRVLHNVVTDAGGTTTISKGGATFSAALSP
jgi:hypothetical protein